MPQADPTSRRIGAAVSTLWSAPAWRATGNALAALLVALVGSLLLGGLALILRRCGPSQTSRNEVSIALPYEAPPGRGW